MLSFPIHIPTNDLKLSDVPEENSDWHTISRFALTFDPKESDSCPINDDDSEALTSNTDLVRLRSSLFSEQRRWNHFGHKPDVSAMQGIQKIISLIKDKLK